ncbi:hypothetical protein BUALT_Bualt14G0094100 [Buddleja alternifolia]|uniref:Uncharacterized protein n=1 Tax=Buddleja alternifolia TaxID=168488 RepID=A0AAV6WRN8_9LAMI|nr:hypothetical protein BUALT_Bualt14G0094100 [Buddleja alternifolia]
MSRLRSFLLLIGLIVLTITPSLIHSLEEDSTLSDFTIGKDDHILKKEEDMFNVDSSKHHHHHHHAPSSHGHHAHPPYHHGHHHGHGQHKHHHAPPPHHQFSYFPINSPSLNSRLAEDFSKLIHGDAASELSHVPTGISISTPTSKIEQIRNKETPPMDSDSPPTTIRFANVVSSSYLYKNRKYGGIGQIEIVPPPIMNPPPLTHSTVQQATPTIEIEIDPYPATPTTRSIEDNDDSEDFCCEKRLRTETVDCCCEKRKRKDPKIVSAKGKEKVTHGGGGKGKRKWNADDDKTGRKRKNRSVLQFFEDTAYQVNDGDDSSDDDSLFDDDEYGTCRMICINSLVGMSSVNGTRIHSGRDIAFAYLAVPSQFLQTLCFDSIYYRLGGHEFRREFDDERINLMPSKSHNFTISFDQELKIFFA